MKMTKSLAAKILVLTLLVYTSVAGSALAGIPVFDGGNLTQNIVSAIEGVAQTMKQIEQYRTQLQQYENMLQNTTRPTTFEWDRASTTMNNLRRAVDTLNYYKVKLGSIDDYLGKFQDISQYRNSPCFSENGCSEAEWAALWQNRELGSESQKKATDALFRGLEQQQDAMEADARTLQRLQVNAQGATGQLQAVGYANQLASQQSNQLLQIRALLIAQQNAVATRDQALADREAQEAAFSVQLRKSNYRPSPVRGW